jgi:hypothetical protein
MLMQRSSSSTNKNRATPLVGGTLAVNVRMAMMGEPGSPPL